MQIAFFSCSLAEKECLSTFEGDNMWLENEVLLLTNHVLSGGFNRTTAARKNGESVLGRLHAIIYSLKNSR